MMKKRVTALLMAAALMIPLPALAADPVPAADAPAEISVTEVEAPAPEAEAPVPEADPSAPEAEAPVPEADPSVPEDGEAAPEEEPSGESAGETEEAAEESDPVQLLAGQQTEVHASTGEELMRYLTDGASDLEITLDGNKDYVICNSYTASGGEIIQNGFSVENLRNVTVRGKAGTRILTPSDCGDDAVITLISCTDVTLDTLSIGHLDSWCLAPVLVLDQSTGVELLACDLWGCGYFGIRCRASSFHAQYTVIRDCKGYILDFAGGKAVFDNCIFRNNGAGDPEAGETREATALQGTPSSAVFNSCQFLRNQNAFKLEAAAASKYTFNNCTEVDNGWNSTESITLSVGTSANLTLVGGAATITGTGAVDSMSYENFSKIASQVTTLTVGSGITELGDDSLGGLTVLREVSLPDSLTRIGDRAFSGDSLLTRITIPDRVTSIGREAFEGCYLLREVTLSGSSTLTELGAYAFSGCGLLTAITLPGSLRTVGQSAFDECAGLKSLVFPEGVETIDGYVCQNCTGLRELTLPSTLTALGNEAFKTCTNLETLTLPATVSLSSGAFAKSYEKLSRVILTGSGPMAAFSSYSTPWSGIACPFTVEIREGVTSISDSAFSNRQSLTAVSLPDSVETIGNYAFSGCSGLTELNLSNGVTSIGTRAFFGCSSLTKVKLPSGAASIGTYAFSGCSGLTELSIPNSVTAISERCFENCTNLRAVSLPEKLQSIGSYAFSGCSSLETIDLPRSLTAIGNYAFSNAGFRELVLPESLTSLGSQAFGGCTKLETLTLPAAVTPDASSLSSFSSLSLVVLTGSGQTASYGSAIASPWQHIPCPFAVEIREGVTGIGNCTFAECANLTSVAFPDTLQSIGSSAFYKCSGLTELELPDSVGSVGNFAFRYCTGLRSVSIPMTAVCGENTSDQVFLDCTGITRVKLRGTGDIGSMKGGNCNSGTPWCATKAPVTVELAEGITGIGEYVFRSCSSLTTVVIPNTVTHIDNEAFKDSGLESLTLPSSVTSIGKLAFSESKLTRITVPASVTSIGAFAFGTCRNKPTIYYGGTKEQWETALNGQNAANSGEITVLYNTSESAYMTAQLDEIMKNTSLTDVKTGLEKLNTGSLSDALLVPENRQKLADKEGATSVQAGSSSPIPAESVTITGAKVNFPEQQNLTLVLAGPGNPEISVPAQGKVLRFSAKLVNGGTEVPASGLTVPMAVTIRLPDRKLSEQSVRVWHSHGETLTELRFLQVERRADGVYLTFLLDGFSDLVVTYGTGFFLTLNGSTVRVQDDQNTLANCQKVLLARYDGGRLTKTAAGTLSGNQITFAEVPAAGDVLFFLNGNHQPVREKAALS